MNPNFKSSPEDQLIEELLHEQHHGTDDAFLQQIENAVDGAAKVSNKRPASTSWARYGIAAGIALAVGGTVWWQTEQRNRVRFAISEAPQANPEIRQRMAAEAEMRRLTKSIQLQADKVEERRKVLSTIIREKGIIYKGDDSSDLSSHHIPEAHEEAIKRGLDAQDYGDAKRDFETDQKQLLDLRARQMELAASSGVDVPEEVESKPHVSEQSKILEGGLAKAPGMPKPADVVSRSSLPQAEKVGMDKMSELSSLQGAAMTGGLGGGATGMGLGSGTGLGSGRGERKVSGAVLEESVERRRARVQLSSPSNTETFGTDSFAMNGVGRSHRLSDIRGMMVDRRDSQLAPADRYGQFIDQPWKTPTSDPLSTFSIDVDTASYGNVRRMILENRSVPRDAVRIEECINAFAYHYQVPKGDAPFAVGASLATCPWNAQHQLVRVAIKGREIDAAKRPASNLVFLIDVSGSMQSPDKLPLLKQSMTTLVEQLDDRDRVSVVVYAGSEGVALPSTRIDAEGRAKVLQTLANLQAGGSTNGGAGIKRAYQLAMDAKIVGGVNRVILATDGDFNVGVTGNEELVSLVKERAKSGVYLTVLGYGTGNLNDSMMDSITRDGNGNYFYIDSEREGRKVFLRNLAGTLVTIAKDVKIQVEFNPAKVGGYRLIGYANRVLKNEDFNNDKVDAGDIGAGHTVTAFYEITPKPVAGGTDALKYQQSERAAEPSNEWLTVKLRHKHPDGDDSRKIEFALVGDVAPIANADTDFQFASAVALFGMKLRGMEEVTDVGWDKIKELASPGLSQDADEDRAEFVSLLNHLAGVREKQVPAPAEVIQGDR